MHGIDVSRTYNSILWSSFPFRVCCGILSVSLLFFLLKGVALRDDLLLPSL